MGGNALTEYMVFGKRAGIYATKHAKKAKLGKITLKHVIRYEKMLENVSGLTGMMMPPGTDMTLEHAPPTDAFERSQRR